MKQSNNLRLPYSKDALPACWELRCCLDPEKMFAYDAFFKKYAKDKTIIDLGSGSGVMGWLAYKYGAKKVYCVEYVERYIPVIEKMLEEYPQTEIIHGDASKIQFPEADIIIHEIFGHNVIDEYIIPISRNIHKQGMLDKVTPKKIEWVQFKAEWIKYSNYHIEHDLNDFPESMKEFLTLYAEKVEDWTETNSKYEAWIDTSLEVNDLQTIGYTDLTKIDLINHVPYKLSVLKKTEQKENKQDMKEKFGWYAYLDDEIKFSNILRQGNNWTMMPGGRGPFNRFIKEAEFNENINPLATGAQCQFLV